jgi:hypothetical protein
MKRTVRSIAAAAVFLAPCTMAQAEQVTFFLRLAGIKLGTLAYADDVGPTSYAAGMRFQTGGLTGLMTNVTFEARSRGRRTPNGDLSTASYREESLRDGEREVTEIVWEGKTPAITVETPPQPDRLDPQEAVGSVDLMTGLHMLFRAIPAQDACKVETTTYDGKRLMRLLLDDAGQDRSGHRICSGTFRRLKGVAPQGMIDTMFSGFDMTYRSLPDGRIRVARMVLQTPLGRAILAVE